MADAKEILDWITKNVDPAKMKEVEQILKDLGEEHQPEKPMSDKSKAALQAIARIASPMKDEVHPGHLVKVLQAAGYDMHKAMEMFGNPDGGVHHPDGEPPHDLHDSSAPLEKNHFKAIPAEVLMEMKDVLKAKLEKGEPFGSEDGSAGGSEEDDEGDELEKAISKHMRGAYGEAEKAYKSHMEKLGYRKYPDAEVRMKGVRKDLPKQVDVSEENHEKGEAQPMDKNVLKSLDLTKVDPKVKTALEAVFKANEEAVKKALKLEGELKAERETRLDKELMDRAKAIGHGAVEKHFKIMKSLSTELRDEYESAQHAVTEQIKKGGIFKELGSARQGTINGGDAWGKIEAMANGIVEKGDTKVSKAEAIEAVLKTAEGKRLYSEYMSAKPNMAV